MADNLKNALNSLTDELKRHRRSTEPYDHVDDDLHDKDYLHDEEDHHDEDDHHDDYVCGSDDHDDGHDDGDCDGDDGGDGGGDW